MACDTGLLVEMKDIGIAHDIPGAGGADERNVDLLSDQGLEEGVPRSPAGGGVLVGEVEDLDPVSAVEPGDLSGEPRLACARRSISPTPVTASRKMQAVCATRAGFAGGRLP